MAMLTDEVRAAYEAVMREKEKTLERMIYPPVIATPARGGGKTLTVMEMTREEMLQHRRMDAMRYMTTPWDVFPPAPTPQRTYTEEELQFRMNEAAARASQIAHNGIADRIAVAADAAFERGRAYVDPTPKAPLPIHNAMRATLRAIEQYENKVFLPGGLLPLMHDA